MRATAWGRDGHQIVAGIALWRLDKLKAKNALKNITAILKTTPETPVLRQPRDFFQAAVWPDDVRGSDKYSFADNLHFVSIELKQDGSPDKYIKNRDCRASSKVPQVPEGVCIIGALEHYTRVLATSTKKSERIEALAFIVHFMGDIHQPLHTSEDKTFINHLEVNGKKGRGDRGGNHRFIFYLTDGAFNSDDIESCLLRPNVCTDRFVHDGVEERSNKKLHAAWDKYMIRTEMNTNPNRKPDFKAYTSDLLRQLPPSPIASFYTEIEQGDFVTWAEEAHHLAELNAYELIGPKIKVSPADEEEYAFYLLNDAYRARNIRIVDQQLIRAGIRLALVLRKIFPES